MVDITRALLGLLKCFQKCNKEQQQGYQHGALFVDILYYILIWCSAVDYNIIIIHYYAGKNGENQSK